MSNLPKKGELWLWRQSPRDKGTYYLITDVRGVIANVTQLDVRSQVIAPGGVFNTSDWDAIAMTGKFTKIDTDR